MLCFPSGTASDSICPKGWRLPGYSGSGSFLELLKPYSNRTVNASGLENLDTVAQISSLTFIYSGDISYSSGGLAGFSSGLYWSNRSYVYYGSYLLSFDSTHFTPQNGGDRGYGLTLRCLAR